MHEIKRVDVNTNNAWGFGGWSGNKIYYSNGLINEHGKYYYRHLPPDKCDRWLYQNGENECEICNDKKKYKSLFLAKSLNEDYYHFIWGMGNDDVNKFYKKRTGEYADSIELILTIE